MATLPLTEPEWEDEAPKLTEPEWEDVPAKAQASLNQAFKKPAPSTKSEPALSETLARKGLGAATAVTEIVPGATQAVAGLRSAFGDRTYEDELARVREEQQMMRKLEPATTGITRGAGNVALSVPAVALGGPLGLAALTGAQALSRGTGVGQAALEAGVGGLAGPVLSRAPAAVQAVAPVVATAGGMLGAKDQSALWEAITGLAPAAAAAISQGVRGAYRGLTGRAEKAEKQLLSTKGAEIAGLRQEELEKAAADVASAEARRRALTGEQQTRLANAPRLEEAGARMGLAPAPPELLPSEALPEAQKAYESFFRNAPEKFTEEAARVAAQQAEARAAETAAQAKWSDPLAVAETMRPVGPVTPGPVPPELEAAARLLQQRELTAARARVPEEIKGAAVNRAVWGSTAGVPAYLLGQRVVPITAGTAAASGILGAGVKTRQLLAVDPKTKLFKDPAAANVIYDVIPSVVRKFPDAFGKYLSLATDAGIRARPVFLLEAIRRDPDLARAIEEEVTGTVSEE
jgi:hypothetical protein